MNLENDSLASSITIESIRVIIDEMIEIEPNVDAFLIICSALNVARKGFIDEMDKKIWYLFYYLYSRSIMEFFKVSYN